MWTASLIKSRRVQKVALEALWPKSTHLFLFYTGGFLSNMLHISLLRCTFISYAGEFLSNAANFSRTGHFSPTLTKFLFSAKISLPRWRVSVLCCTFLSYAGEFLSYAGEFLSYAGEFLSYACQISTRIYLAEQRHS